MSVYNYIKSIFSNDVLIQVWENRIKVSNIYSKKVFDEEPLMALKNNKKAQTVIEAIGNSVNLLSNKDEYTIINPFSHPRLLMHDFTAAEKLLQHTFREIHKDKLFVPSPRVVFQPMEKLEGGITDIESRAFRELCLGAGAREAFIYIGDELSIHTIDIEKIINSID